MANLFALSIRYRYVSHGPLELDDRRALGQSHYLCQPRAEHLSHLADHRAGHHTDVGHRPRDGHGAGIGLVRPEDICSRVLTRALVGIVIKELLADRKDRARRLLGGAAEEAGRGVEGERPEVVADASGHRSSRPQQSCQLGRQRAGRGQRTRGQSGGARREAGERPGRLCHEVGGKAERR